MSNVAPNHLPLQLAHQKAGDAALFKEHHMVLLGDPSCLQLATQSWMQGAGQTASSPVTTNQPLNLEILVGPELHRVSATRVDRVHVKPIELIVGAPEVDGIVIACDSSCDDTIRKVEQLLFVLAQVRQRSLFKCGFIVDTRYPLPQPNAPTGCLGALKELVELHECQFLALPTASSLDPETNPLMNRTSLAQKHSNLMTDGNSSTADGSSFDMPGNGIPGTSSPIWSRISALHTPSRALRVLEEIVRTLSTTKITLKSDRRLVGKAVLFRDLTPSSLYPVVAMKQPLQSMPLTLASFVEVLHASHRTRRLVLAAPSHSRHLSLVKHVAGLVPGRHRSPSAGTDDGSTELPSLMSLAALEIAATHGGRDRKTDELVAVLATLPDHVNEVVLHEHWSWATIQGLAKRQLRQGTRENRRRSVERKSAAFAKAQTNGAGGVFAAPVVMNKKLQPLVPNGRSQKGQDATAVALDVPTAGLTLRVESVPDVTFVALDWPVCTPTHRGAVQQAAGLHHARGSVGSVLSALRRRGLKGSQSLNVMDAPKQLSAHQTQSAPEMPNVAVSDSTLDEGHLSVSSLEAVNDVESGLARMPDIGVSELVFHRCGLASRGSAALLSAVLDDTSARALTSMRIQQCELGASTVAACLQAVCESETLLHLTLRDSRNSVPLGDAILSQALDLLHGPQDPADPLSDIAFRGTGSLASLSLSGNNLGAFVQWGRLFSLMPQLATLDLSRCQLSGNSDGLERLFEALSETCPCLTSLSLASNGLTSLPRLALPSIETGNMAEDCSEPKSSSNLLRLVSLDLSHNKLTRLPKWLSPRPATMTLLQLTGNPIENLHGLVTATLPHCLLRVKNRAHRDQAAVETTTSVPAAVM